MADLKRAFDDLDRLDMPLSWSDVTHRRPGPPLREPDRPRRILVVGLAFAVAAVGIAFAVRAFLLAPSQRPSSGANGKIVFVRGASSAHARLWSVNPVGTGAAPLTALPGYSEDPSWSPDGTRVVFSYGPRVGSPRSLYTVNADGSGLKRLTTCEEPDCFQDVEPAWSPDGAEIAFVRNQDVYVMNADGTNVQRLTHATTPLGDGQPAWSPDGRKIAFVVPRVQPYDVPAIYVMNDDGKGMKRLTDCLPRCIDSQPAWAPDGTKIAFTRRFDVYVMNPDGSGAQPLTDCAHIPGCVAAGGPVWSPDGREIAFWVEGQDSNRHLYIMNADGTNARPLTPKTADDCCLAWQPVPVATTPTTATRAA